MREDRMMLIQQPNLALKPYEAEMDEMGCLDFMVHQEMMVRRERKERLEPLDHRDLLDPGVVGFLCEVRSNHLLECNRN